MPMSKGQSEYDAKIASGFYSFGGSMVEVQEIMAKLSATDPAAIASSLESISAIASDKGESQQN